MRYLTEGAQLLPLLFAVYAGPVSGESVDTVGPDASRIETATLNGILVTARRRPETLQDVPISASVLNGPAIADQNILSLQELATTLPAVTFSKGDATDNQFIRGIGSGNNPSFEQSVGTFIDDVYYGRARSAENALFDVDRVEVLKGPQTVYFGNNAVAGALNIRTRDPGATRSGHVRIAYTPDFDGYSAEAALDSPVSPTLATRVALLATGGSGWINDYGSGEHVPRTRNAALRATFLWEPMEQMTARLKVGYSRERERGGLPIVTSSCPQNPPFPSPTGFCAVNIDAGVTPLSGDFARNTSRGQRTDLTAQDFVGTLALTRAAFTVTSVTAFTRYGYKLDTDVDGTPFNLLSAIAPEEYRQLSQELRIVSVGNTPLEYTAGAYYQHGRLHVQDAFVYGFLGSAIENTPGLMPLVPYLPLTIDDEFREFSDSNSAFGALTWHLSHRLRITGAGRYTLVNKHFEQAVGLGTVFGNFGPLVLLPAAVAPLAEGFARASGLATAGSVALARKDSHWAPSLSIQYDLSDAAMTYLRYDNGFKAGGFNGSDLGGNPSALPFAPEKVDSFELGVKAKLLHDRLGFYIDTFRSQYRDLQLAAIEPSVAGSYVNRVQNAGGAVSRGVEIGAELSITPRVRASLTATYLDDYYTRYPNAAPTSQQTLEGLNAQDLAGRSTPFAPRLSESGSIAYVFATESGITYRAENRLFVTSGYFLNFNNDPNLRQGGYARDDLTLAMAGGNKWEVSLTADNLADKTILTYGAPAPVTLGAYGLMTQPPRSVTIQAQWTF